MGMKHREREVMELWDRGFAKGRIAVQLGITPLRVSVILSTFARTDEARVEREMMTAGSAQLASALAEMSAS